MSAYHHDHGIECSEERTTIVDGERQVAATGFSYKKLIEEFETTAPTEPEIFLKASTSLTGPHDPISRGPNPA
jgi:2,4-diketo-3-deoxy-L-fuconate hydrolase